MSHLKRCRKRISEQAHLLLNGSMGTEMNDEVHRESEYFLWLIITFGLLYLP